MISCLRPSKVRKYIQRVEKIEKSHNIDLRLNKEEFILFDSIIKDALSSLYTKEGEEEIKKEKFIKDLNNQLKRDMLGDKSKKISELIYELLDLDGYFIR